VKECEEAWQRIKKEPEIKKMEIRKKQMGK